MSELHLIYCREIIPSQISFKTDLPILLSRLLDENFDKYYS